MNKVDLSVGELVGMIARGELQLPEMQRRYVWRGPRVRDLLDSLYRGYPSGAILVWETADAAPTRELQVAQAETTFATKRLLLDGQQRLTSLSAVLRGEPVRVRGRRKPIDILFNLDHPDTLEEVTEVEGDEGGESDEDDDADEETEESLHERLRRMTFVVASKAMAALPNWVPVTKVMTTTGDAEFLKPLGVTSLDDPRCAKYGERLRRLRDIRKYPYVMHLLDRGLRYEEVAEIFVRVNSLGVKLRSSDLALAQISARWRNLLPLLDAFQDEVEEMGFTLDHSMLVRSMVVFASGQCKFQSVGSIATKDLQAGWERAKAGLHFACNFLKANGGIERQHLIQSHHIFPKARLRDSYDRREINELANLAFIGGGTNRGFGTKLPEEYFPGVIAKRGEDALAGQCVPLDPAVWKLETYPAFLAARRREIVGAVNAFLDAVTQPRSTAAS